MKAKLALAGAMVVILLAVGTCAPALGGAKESSIEVSIDDFMNAKNITREIRVAADGTLTVTLSSNPTTGFGWTESAEIANKTILEQTDHQFIPPEGASTAGASGKEVWTFKALKEGQTAVSMDYSRPWEGGEKGEWTFRLTVVVE